MSGLMGGLIGAGIGGLLFGHGFFGGMLGFGGFLGFLLQIFLIVLLVRFLIRLFRGPSPAFAGGPACSPAARRPDRLRPMGGGGSAATAAARRSARSDYQEFEQLLQDIQAAWSRAGPERAARHGHAGDAELLRRAACRPDQPRRAQRGDRRAPAARRPGAGLEREQGREYATVAMRFSMIDVTRDACRPDRRWQPDRARHRDRAVDLRPLAGRAVDPVGDPAGAIKAGLSGAPAPSLDDADRGCSTAGNSGYL